MSFRKKYPVGETVYRQKVGKLLPHRIGQILKELGYTKKSGYRIWVNPRQGNDVDLKVWFYNNLILVSEIINWSIASILSKKRRNKMIFNLFKYNCHRVVIYTVPLDRKHWLKFRKRRIPTLKIGFQVLPEFFYAFFKSKKQVTKRRIDSKETTKHIKLKIFKYLLKK